MVEPMFVLGKSPKISTSDGPAEMGPGVADTAVKNGPDDLL